VAHATEPGSPDGQPPQGPPPLEPPPGQWTPQLPHGPGPTPQGFGKDKKRRNLEIVGLIGLLIVVLLVGRSCLGFAAEVVAEQLPYSVDADIGKAGAEQMRAKYALAGSPTPAQVARVDKIFDELRDALHDDEKKALINARVTVVVDDTPNAFALPGGEVFVLTGLLDRVEDDDDQIRGVLAHELGHAVKRHGLRSLARRAAFGIVLTMMLGGDDFLSTLIGGAADLEQLSHSRGMETEADEFGTALLLRTGHDVEGLARFLEDLGDQPVPELLSTHPDPVERAAEIRERAARRDD
jgi:predicted Zn-dependent protease